MRTLVALLTLALLAFSQVSAAEDYDMADYEVMDTNTLMPTETSHPVVPTTTNMPPISTTPSPPSSVAPTFPPAPSNPVAQRYTLQDFNSNATKTCLNMTAVFQVLILNGAGGQLVNVTLANNSQVGLIRQDSTCMSSDLKATVYFVDADQPSTFAFVMRFNGSADYWSIEEVGLTYGGVAFTTNSTLDRNTQNVSSTRSFKCDSNVDFIMSNITANPNQYSAKVTVSSLRVQVFRFKAGDGELGDVISCTVDSKQNKIVPIAVGAALAGLVVVVLIAYLIGRLRSRKQSSYEALS